MRMHSRKIISIQQQFMLLYRCSHALHNCFWGFSKPLWVGVLSDWVCFPPQTSTLVCVGKKPRQSISPLRCGPLVEQSQVSLHETNLGIQYYFQIFPDFIQLNSAETPVLLFTQKNISNQYQIRNTIILLQTLWESLFHCPAPAWIFPGFLEFFLQVLHVLLVMIPFKEAFYPKSKANLSATSKFAFFPTLQLRFDFTIQLISLFPSYKLSTIWLQDARGHCALLICAQNMS